MLMPCCSARSCSSRSASSSGRRRERDPPEQRAPGVGVDADVLPVERRRPGRRRRAGTEWRRGRSRAPGPARRCTDLDPRRDLSASVADRAVPAAVPMSSPGAHPVQRAGQRLAGQERLVALDVHDDVEPGELRPRRPPRPRVGAGLVCRSRSARRATPAAPTTCGDHPRSRWPPRGRRRRRAPATRWATRTTRGTPASSCSGLSGSRVEPSRAGNDTEDGHHPT